MIVLCGFITDMVIANRWGGSIIDMVIIIKVASEVSQMYMTYTKYCIFPTVDQRIIWYFSSVNGDFIFKTIEVVYSFDVIE